MKKIITLAAVVAALLCLTPSCTKEAYDTDATISGFMVDYATGSPLANVLLTLSPTQKNSYSGIDGSFEFSGLESQTYTLSVQKEGYKSNNFRIYAEPGVVTQKTLAMEKE